MKSLRKIFANLLAAVFLLSTTIFKSIFKSMIGKPGDFAQNKNVCAVNGDNVVLKTLQKMAHWHQTHIPSGHFLSLIRFPDRFQIITFFEKYFCFLTQPYLLRHRYYAIRLLLLWHTFSSWFPRGLLFEYPILLLPAILSIWFTWHTL